MRLGALFLVFLTLGFSKEGGGINDTKEKRVLVHGHRGSRGTHPENSIPAFEEALEVGAQVLELDLQLTKDNIPVLWHDAELRPDICQGKGLPVLIRALSRAELKNYACGTFPHAKFPNQKKIAVPIIALSEFFEWAQSKGTTQEFNIETKMNGPNNPDPELFVRQVLKVVSDARVEARVILQSFDFSTLKVAHRLNPKIRLSAIFEHKADFCSEAKQIGAAYISPQFELVEADTVSKCRAIGIQVAPWTLNSPDEWKKALALGVDAIITDYPRQLAQFISAQ